MPLKILSLIFLLSAGVLQAQDPVVALNWKSDVTVNTYLLEKMHQQYDQRKLKLMQAGKNKPSAQKYVNDVRAASRSLIAPRLRRKVSGDMTNLVIEKDFRVENIRYQGFAGTVTANLYIPAGKGPFPAILFLCGHEDLAKATESYQQTARALVKNGFVVFVIDPISQAERHQFVDSAFAPLTRGGTTEHTLINQAAALFGLSTAIYQVWDNQDGIDYLFTRPEVDTTRLGCVGNSGGAIQTIYLSSVEPRIKVISVSSYFSSRERTFDLTGAADGCAHIPGEGEKMLEMNDFLLAAAPKPILVTAGRYDFIDYKGATDAFGEMQRIYNLLASPGSLSMYTYDDGHGLSKPKRDTTVAWFRRWLNPGPVVRTDDLVTIMWDRLRVSPYGQVIKSYKEKGIRGFHEEQWNKTDSLREAFRKLPVQTQRDRIRTFIRLEVDPAPEIDSARSNRHWIGKTFKMMTLRSVGQPPLPLARIEWHNSSKGPLLILHDGGMKSFADSTRQIHRFLDMGYTVFLADVRGFGETADKAALNDPKYFNKEYRNTMLAIHNGWSLPAQRVTDIVNLVDFIFGQTGEAVSIIASGAIAVPALHATALHPKIRHVSLVGGNKSYRDILEYPIKKDYYSIVIPGVLRMYDLPDLVRLAGETRVNHYERFSAIP